MTDQPIANSELAEQLTSLSDRLDREISNISELLARADQLCHSALESEAKVVATRQEIMEAISGVDTGLTDRVGAIEAQLGQLLDSLPRLAQDVKNFAQLAKYMDQCATEVSQWYEELKQAKAGSDVEASLLEIRNGIQSYNEAHQALAEQVALLQGQGVDLSPLEGKIQGLENSFNALEERLSQVGIGSAPIDEGQVAALVERLVGEREQALRGEGTGSTPIDEGQVATLVERLVGEREQSLRNEMTTIQRDWQDGAAILQQMQVRIESLEGRGGDATTAQLEAIRSELTNLVAKAKTEQENALRDQRRQLEELGSQGGKTTIALILGVLALGLGIFGIVRR